MTDCTLAFAIDPTIQLPQQLITELARKHFDKIMRGDADKADKLMEAIVADAATAYGSRRWIKAPPAPLPELKAVLFTAPAPDTLDQAEEPTNTLVALYQNKVNGRRLGIELMDIDPSTGIARVSLAEAKAEIKALVTMLKRVRSAAIKAHIPARGRGHPTERVDLKAAYQRLALHWRTVFGEDKFTAGRWTKTQPPKSAAARFVLDVMRVIDPDRPRLTEGIHDLMTIDVAVLRGPRPGRREG